MKKRISKFSRKVRGRSLSFMIAGSAQAQALASVPELSPVKMVILSVLDAYGLWKIIQCVKNGIDHLADSSKGDPGAKDRIWGTVLSIIGILMVGVFLNYLILKAGNIGAKPVSSVLSGN